jgi:hypothetical protein
MEKKMSRHVLTVEEQIRGLRRAIASPRTPPHLKKYLEQRREALAEKLDHQRRSRMQRPKSKRPPGLLDWLGL